MNQAENEKRVTEFYNALAADFQGAVDNLIDKEIEWVNPLPESIPFGGIYKGADGLLDYFQKLSAAIEMAPLHFTEIVGVGNVVSAIGVEENTLVLSTGKRYTMPCVHVVRFNDAGKVNHVREYNDIYEMLKAFEQ